MHIVNSSKPYIYTSKAMRNFAGAIKNVKFGEGIWQIVLIFIMVGIKEYFYTIAIGKTF